MSVSIFILALSPYMLGTRLNTAIGTYEMEFGSDYCFSRNHSRSFPSLSVPALVYFLDCFQHSTTSLPNLMRVGYLFGPLVWSLNVILRPPHFWVSDV